MPASSASALRTFAVVSMPVLRVVTNNHNNTTDGEFRKSVGGAPWLSSGLRDALLGAGPGAGMAATER